MTGSRATVLRFPSDLVDRDRVPLLIGAWVTVVGGPHSGEHGEVTDWAGERRVRVAVDDAGSIFPALHVVDADDLSVDVTSNRIRTSSGLEIHDTAASDVLLVVPVGGQDIQVSATGDRGPFPDPDDFATSRTGRQRKVDARRWGEACLQAIRERSPADQAAEVARHLDAPMLRRAFVDATLPRSVRRVAFIVTDQDSPRHRGDDTVHFGRLLHLWLEGTADQRSRTLAEVAEPIVLRRDPHLAHSVLYAVRRELPRLLDGIDQLVVVQAGGTPAMAMGTTLAAATRVGLPIRLVTPAKDGPLIEVRFPALVPAVDVERVALNAAQAGQPDIADALYALVPKRPSAP